MGPVERGLLECAANGTLSPQGRVSPLAQALKNSRLSKKKKRTPGFPWGVVCAEDVPTHLSQAGAQLEPALIPPHSPSFLISLLLGHSYLLPPLPDSTPSGPRHLQHFL